MRCKTCDYPLWNLKTRQCPECGGSYLPSDFDFVINSVRFCCPHCAQVYYGTGARGHLVPQEFDCVTCGNHVAMNEMLLRPAEGVVEQQTQMESMPWLERQRRGSIRAWFATVGKALVLPINLMRALPIESPLATAIVFAIITNLLIAIVSGVPRLLFFALVFIPTGAAPARMVWRIFPIFGTSIVLMAILPAILILCCTPMVHGLLRITGPTQSGMNRTAQALAYSSGANVASAVPCFGIYFGWIWWVISAILMVKEGQRVSGWRASLAVLLPALAGLAGWIAVFFFSVTIMMGGIARGGAAWAAYGTPQTQTSIINAQLISYAAGHGGNGPGHALELLDSNFGAANFVSQNTGTDAAQVKVANTTLDQVEYLPPNRQRIAIQSAAANLPANVLAHRLGDFVFTYHGIDFNNCDPGLWLVVFSPDPLTASRGNIAPVVGFANGATQTLPLSYQTFLQAQNNLRAQYNLPPLPDPATVTHAKPAVADSESEKAPEDPAENTSPNTPY